MPKTRAERYELYEEVGINGPTSFNPQCILQPNTDVDIVQEGAAWSKGSWTVKVKKKDKEEEIEVGTRGRRIDYHFVEVEQGPAKGKFGYLPRFSMLDCDLMQAKVGLASVPTTGQTYGAGGVPKGDDHQASFVAKGHGLYFQLPFKGKEACPYCGGTVINHSMDESKDAKTAATAVYDALRGLRNQIGGGFMIGVLKVVGGKGGSYLAVSNGYRKDREPDLEKIANQLKLTFVDSDEVNAWDYLRDFTGNKITEIGDARVNIKNMYRDFLNCAGPRLLQRVLHSFQGEEVTFQGTLFLSEVWFQPGGGHDNYGDRGTAESCEKCAIMIPRMLCGYKRPK